MNEIHSYLKRAGEKHIRLGSHNSAKSLFTFPKQTNHQYNNFQINCITKPNMYPSSIKHELNIITASVVTNYTRPHRISFSYPYQFTPNPFNYSRLYPKHNLLQTKSKHLAYSISNLYYYSPFCFRMLTSLTNSFTKQLINALPKLYLGHFLSKLTI